MTDEPNKPKSMDEVRLETYETIAMAEDWWPRLSLLKIDLELYGGNSPAATEAMHKVLEAHTVVCEQLKTLRRVLAAT